LRPQRQGAVHHRSARRVPGQPKDSTHTTKRTQSQAGRQCAAQRRRSPPPPKLRQQRLQNSHHLRSGDTALLERTPPRRGKARNETCLKISPNMCERRCRLQGTAAGGRRHGTRGFWKSTRETVGALAMLFRTLPGCERWEKRLTAEVSRSNQRHWTQFGETGQQQAE
jgi:hypothetical protein